MTIKLSIFCCDFVLCRHGSHVFVMFSLFLDTFLSKKVTNKWQTSGVKVEEKKTIAIKKIPHDKKWQKRWQIVYMMIASPGLQPNLLIPPFSFFEDISPVSRRWKATQPSIGLALFQAIKTLLGVKGHAKLMKSLTVVIIMIAPDGIMMFHDSYLYTASYLQPVLMHRLPIQARIPSSADVPTGRDFQDPCHYTYPANGELQAWITLQACTLTLCI